MHHSNSVANLASMLDPERPHSIPSSPISVLSDDDLPETASDDDSVPIFDRGPHRLIRCLRQHLADAETVPADPPSAHAASDPSVCLLDRTGSSADDSAFETQYSALRLDPAALLEHVTSNSWTSVVVGAMNPLQTSNLLLRQEIRYGDDCSGARAPYEALCQLVTFLDHNSISSVPIEDMFASECPGPDGDGPRSFIDAQCNPDIMFETVHRGVSTCGMNLHTGTHVHIPTNITVYCAGWVCRDVSTMNQHRKELLPGDHPKVCAGKAGASSQTLDSSMRYIKIHCPDIALLENLVHKKNIEIAIQALKAIGGYSTCVLLIDSRTFSVPMSRRRMYILAVRTHLLNAPLGDLVSQLRDIAKTIQSTNPVSTTSLAALLDTDPVHKSSPQRMSSKACVRVRAGEKKRSKWRRQHDQIRSACGLPTRTEIVDKVKAHSPMAASLPLRCQELLGLHWEVAVQHGIEPRDHHFVWDLTNSAKFSCVKSPHLSGIVPCALRGHILWDTRMGRQLSGTELMRVHGFCVEPAVAQLQNGIIRQLAGDTISVPPVGCILTLALANTAPSHVQVAEQ